MSIEFIVIIWLYVFGLIGIWATQAAMNGRGRNLFEDLRRGLDWPSFLGMLAWPITVPLFALLATYDVIQGK